MFFIIKEIKRYKCFRRAIKEIVTVKSKEHEIDWMFSRKQKWIIIYVATALIMIGLLLNYAF
jgi:hypothetical protein